MKTIAVLVLMTNFLFCQAYKDSIQIAMMARLPDMEGIWIGEGWAIKGKGERSEFIVTEKILKKFDGKMILMEGSGKNKETGEAGHQALGILSYDPYGNKYKLRSVIRAGMFADADVVLNDNGSVTWSFSIPQGKIRYTFKVSNGEWHETGEFSQDDIAWVKNFEMRLKKQ